MQNVVGMRNASQKKNIGLLKVVLYREVWPCGGLKHFLFLPLPTEMIQFDEHYRFFKWVVEKAPTIDGEEVNNPIALGHFFGRCTESR